jgi:hypothetical protein
VLWVGDIWAIKYIEAMIRGLSVFVHDFIDVPDQKKLTGNEIGSGLGGYFGIARIVE